MPRIKKQVVVKPIGSLYSFKTGCKTLKEVMKTYPQYAKRSWIKEWWKEPL